MTNGKSFWLNFLRRCALQADQGSLRQFDGLEAAWVHSLLPINNATWLASAPESVEDLQKRCARAAADAEGRNLPWLFYLFEPELTPPMMAEADAIAAGHGLHLAAQLRVMLGDVAQLATPRYTLPAVEFVRAISRDTAWKALDLNTRAYSMPLEITDSVVDSGAYFRDQEREFGFVAVVDGEPVATATVIEINGWLYVAAVATAPGHRQKGYAEAVMRHALTAAAAARGITRTALDASLMGSTLYKQMGYKATGEMWRMYMSA